MAFGSTLAVALEGLTGHLVEVQAHLAFSVPGFTLIGLPDTALSEAKDRVRAALHSRKVKLPDKKITVNLSPASLRKTGATFDLAIAVAILAGNKAFPPNITQNIVHLGELGLDGRIQPVRGILPMVAAAVAAGYPKVVVATADVPEAELVPGALVAGVATLSDVITLHGGNAPSCQNLPPVPRPRVREQTKTGADLNDVFGQELPKIALEVAAAGGHHLMFVGPPGAGKTMLAARIPTILPDLTDAESVEVTSIH
ncbi:MAG: ATP-binding protein, partial [Promicromonosporaceae bacterium]|nr:ATP-binding protein [Promicromonosporaceae bacterium]